MIETLGVIGVKEKLIIVLSGLDQTGKGTTLSFLHNLLLQNKFEQLNSVYNESLDSFYALMAKSGKVVGITTCCSDSAFKFGNLGYFAESNCDLCITSCNDYNLFDKQVKTDKVLMGYKPFMIAKNINPDKSTQIESNYQQAKSILKMVNELMKS